MRNKKSRLRTVWVLAVLGLLLAAAVAVLWFPGCGDEKCLVWGENCTQQYKQDNYGTTSIQCCNSAQCTDHGSGILTCGA
jgi:hypothetical protein